MPKSLALFATMVLLAGCATANRQPIEAKAGAALQGQTLASTKRPAASFSAMTPTKAALGVFGVAAMYSEGAGIVNNNQVDDPAGAVGAALAKALAAQRGARLADAALAVDGDDAAQIAGAAQGKARYLIDASTANWALQYFPTDWTHFQVTYSAKARLIDVDSKAVLAEGHCAAPQADSKNAPTYDEMLAGPGLCGSPAEVIDRVGQWQAAVPLPISRFAFMFDLGGMPADRLKATIERFGTEVAPHIR